MVLVTIESIIQLSLLIIAGIAAYKLKLVKDEGIESINNILMHLALPALLLYAFQSDILFGNKAILLPALGISALVQLMSILLSYVFIRKNPNANIERASIAFTNNSFIGIPLLTSMLGETGSFYASIITALNNAAVNFFMSCLLYSKNQHIASMITNAGTNILKNSCVSLELSTGSSPQVLPL